MDSESDNEGKKVKCNSCGYEWISKSKAIFVSCPSCMSKVKIREKRENG